MDRLSFWEGLISSGVWLFIYRDNVVSWVKGLIVALQADAGLLRVHLTGEQWHRPRFWVCLWLLELHSVAKHPASLTFCPLEPFRKALVVSQMYNNIWKRNNWSDGLQLWPWICLLTHCVLILILFIFLWSCLLQYLSSWIIENFALQILTLRRQGRTLYPTVPENAERDAQSLFVQEVSRFKEASVLKGTAYQQTKYIRLLFLAVVGCLHGCSLWN